MNISLIWSGWYVFKQTMLVFMNIGDRQVEVPYGNAIGSNYIKDIIDIHKDIDAQVNITIADKYVAVIDNYINFLKDVKSDPITDKQYMKLCFSLYTYFDDGVYFKYLLQQLFDNWSHLSEMLYYDINNNSDIKQLQWLLFPHCPYHFLPKYGYIDNSEFMDKWQKTVNSNICVNGNERYINKLSKCVRNIFHTINGKSVGAGRKTTYYESGRICSIIECQNDKNGKKLHGVTKFWYDTQREIDDQQNLKEECYYDNDKKCGVERKWNLDTQTGQHHLVLENYYVDDKLHGVSKAYYDTDNDHNGGRYGLKYEYNYVNGCKHGLCKEWYNNTTNSPRNETYYVNDKKCGLYKAWDGHGNCSLTFEGQYLDNKKHGWWKLWHNNNIHSLRSEGKFINDEQHGWWKQWYDNDKHSLEGEGEFINGVRRGLWRGWYNNEQSSLEFEGHYNNGEKVGLWMGWHDGDKHTVAAEIHYDNGYHKEWYNNEQQTAGIPQGEELRHTLECEGQYVNCKKHGLWTHWYNDHAHTIMSEQYYDNGKSYGVYNRWYDNEQHTLECQGGYDEDGKLHGVWMEWYDNIDHTTTRETHYEHDKNCGPKRSWYDNINHTLEYETYYMDNRKHGPHREWFDDEQHTVKVQGYYNNHAKHGLWYQYDIDGNVISATHYLRGEEQ